MRVTASSHSVYWTPFISINLSASSNYLTNFHLLSLNSQGTADEHGFAILSSPNLRGIGTELVQVGEHDDHGKISFFSQALDCLVAGVTPNLKLEYHNRARPSICDLAVSSFLTRFPALTILKLYAWNSGLTTGSIFEHLGSSLHQLTLLPAVNERLSLQDLQEIAQNYPYLEEMTITVSRSKGDAQECAKYKVVGSLPRLQHLALRLDPSDLHVTQEEGGESDHDIGTHIVIPSDPSFNDFGQQSCTKLGYQADGFCRVPRKGHIRDAFINGALDCKKNLKNMTSYTITFAQSVTCSSTLRRTLTSTTSSTTIIV
jgi:hypothetical protein